VLPNAGDSAAQSIAAVGRRWAIPIGCLIGCLAGSVACGADAPVAPAGPPVALRQVSGSGQSAPPGSELGRPLIARLVDANDRPIPGAEVRWSASAGEVTPSISTTDGNGNAVATWRLGGASGVQRATAGADGLEPIEFLAFVDPDAVPDRLPLRAMRLATYDGSGQAVHPDVTLPPFDGLDGRARLALTPYPWGNANMENPSLFAGDGRDAWNVPDGLANPVVEPAGGYLSDPDVVWVPDERELRLYYRHVTSENRILLTRSRDGVTFTESRVVVRAPNHQVVSPAVVRRSAGEWLMWSVNSGASGCGARATTVELRRSADGVEWSAPEPVALTQPGVYPWHVDVQWIPGLAEYWAMFNAKVPGSCTTDALYLATSADGVTWRTFASPVLRSGAIPELADIVYRATFAYDPERDLVSLWHSGARYTSRGYEWNTAYERRRRRDLFDAVDRIDGAIAARRAPPPLDNSTAP
jgi:hypothetical protein